MGINHPSVCRVSALQWFFLFSVKGVQVSLVSWVLGLKSESISSQTLIYSVSIDDGFAFLLRNRKHCVVVDPKTRIRRLPVFASVR